MSCRMCARPRDLAQATALLLGAQNGWLEVVSILLENGADMEACDMGGRTPLSWSAAHGHVNVLQARTFCF